MNERLDGTEPDEVVARHVARYERAIELAGRTGGVWWDVGCGTGYARDIIPSDKVIGFDKEPGDGTRVVDLTDDEWAKGAKRPDVVLCIETLEHLSPEDQEQVVSTIAGKLKTGGVFVACSPIGNGPNPNNPWHVYEPTGRELRGMIARHLKLATYESHDYVSTSGPAVQAYVVGHAV